MDICGDLKLMCLLRNFQAKREPNNHGGRIGQVTPLTIMVVPALPLGHKHLHGPFGASLQICLEQATKWGSVARGSCLPSIPFDLMCFSLVSEPAPEPLMCSRWFIRTGSGSGRECWGQRPFPINRLHELSAAFK